MGRQKHKRIKGGGKNGTKELGRIVEIPYGFGNVRIGFLWKSDIRRSVS
jgi:hypothetical protein